LQITLLTAGWSVKTCKGCGQPFEPTNHRQVYHSVECGRMFRRQLERVRYGTGFKYERRGWVAIVNAGGVRCGRGAECKAAINGRGGLIVPGQKWDLDHLPDGTLHPSHSSCNRRAGQLAGGKPGASKIARCSFCGSTFTRYLPKTRFCSKDCRSAFFGELNSLRRSRDW
jgi:hypothetical protein